LDQRKLFYGRTEKEHELQSLWTDSGNINDCAMIARYSINKLSLNTEVNSFIVGGICYSLNWGLQGTTGLHDVKVSA
jgi:hypothetical protein